VLSVLLASGGRTRPGEAADDKTPARVAFIGPLSGPLAGSAAESLSGLRHALAWHVKSKGAALRRPIEIVTFDDKDEPAEAEKAFTAALAAKPFGIVAASTGRTIDALGARARKGKVPVLFVGSAGPPPRLGVQDPVVHFAGWPVDQALAIANMLVTPCRCRNPALVVEDTPRGRELEAAIARNIGFRRAIAHVVHVAPHAAPTADDVAKLRGAKADRLVLIGEPDLVDATVGALTAASFTVPLLTCDGMCSAGSSAIRDGMVPAGTRYVVGYPQLTMEGAPPSLYQLFDEETKGVVPTIYPRTIAAYSASSLLLEGAVQTGAKPPKELEIVAAIRDQRYGDGEAKAPIVDQTGRAALFHFGVWEPTAKGPAPMNPAFLPGDDYGALLGLRRKEMYTVEPGSKVAWLTFGDEKSRPPRTIEKDLALLHLGTRGYEGNLDEVVKEELMARALGKFNKLFLKNEDGTFIPGVSFNISFTATRPEGLKNPDLWEVVIAGDDAEAGGRAWPGEGHAEVYATFLRRTLFQVGALEPGLSYEDKPWLDDTLPWKGERLEHLRADKLRALIDGYAGSFALTGAHELGHVAGLGHDTTDPRSIMNVVEGAGLRESQVFFVPAHAAILEKSIGRWKGPADEKKR